MSDIFSNWRFNKAGQGCFYSGRIGYFKERDFYFVYDCGTLSKREAIRNEINRIHAKEKFRLNVLTISHLDADHVNLIGELLQPIQCDTVILPYLSRLERLFVLFKHEEAEEGDGDYFDFLNNPVKYILNYNVNEVILIQGDNERGSESNFADVPNNDNPEDPVTKQFIAISEKELSTEQLELKGALVKICKDKGSFFVTKCWEFYFYNKRQETEVLLAFKIWIEKNFGLTINDTGMSQQQFENILYDKSAVEMLKKNFKEFFRDHNSTGLTVMHTQIKPSFFELTLRKKRSHFYKGLRVFRNVDFNITKTCVTLLNADTNLNDINYPNYILQNLQNTRIFQVPHHGSKKNWSINKINQLTVCQMVINFGWGNRFGHPGHDVLYDIKKRGILEKKK